MTEDTQPFTPVFDGTQTVPLVPAVRHRRRRSWLPGVGLILAAGAVGVVWALAQSGLAGPAVVVGPTAYATTRVTPGGTVSIPTDGASMPSSPAVSGSVAAVAVPSVVGSTAVAVRPSPSPSRVRSPSASPSAPGRPSASVASPSGPSGAPSGSSPTQSPSGEVSP